VSQEEHLRSFLHHPIVSHSLGKGYKSEADFTGTRDYSPFWAIPAAAEFATKAGGGVAGGGADAGTGGHAAIRSYCHGLVMAAAHMLAASWRTTVGQPEAMAGHMASAAAFTVLCK
jgi:hypothetical protein